MGLRGTRRNDVQVLESLQRFSVIHGLPPSLNRGSTSLSGLVLDESMWRLEGDEDDATVGPEAWQQLPLALESKNKEKMFKS